MNHFFVKPSDIEGENAYIRGNDVRHISSVLRMKPGDKVLISSGEDWNHLCIIEEIGREEVRLKVTAENETARELPSRITLYQGMPKSDKLELIIQKAVELGAYRIVPVITARTVVKPDAKKAESRRARWQAIAESAAKQSKRGIIPEVGMPLSFKQAVFEAEGADMKLIPYELSSGMKSLKRLLEHPEKCRDIAVFIGPEGGFEESEIELSVSRGFEAVSLGSRILRTETAGFTILAALMLGMEMNNEDIL